MYVPLRTAPHATPNERDDSLRRLNEAVLRSQSVLEAVLSVSMQDCWITNLAPRHGIDIRVIDRKAIGGNRMKDLFETQVPPATIPRLVEEIRSSKGVRNVEVVSTERGRLVGIAYSTNCGGCALLARSDCFIAGAVCRRTSAFEWNLVFRNREALRRLVARLENDGYGVKLLRLATVREAVALTRRQEEILATALELGYFDYPKRIRLGDLAKRLGVSKSTVSQVLRKAQTKVVAAYFDEHPS